MLMVNGMDLEKVKSPYKEQRDVVFAAL